MRVNRSMKLAFEKAMTLANLNKQKIEEEIPDAIEDVKEKIIGGANADFDTLGEVQGYMQTLETNMRTIMEDYRVYTEETYVPKSGNMNDDDTLNFIRTLGLTTESTLINTLEKLKTSIHKLEILIDGDEVVLPDSLSPRTVLSIKLMYPDGRHDDIIHYELIPIDGTTSYKFKGYNHFEDDLLNRTLTFNYTELSSISLTR